MTIDDIKAMPDTMLTPSVAAQIIGCDPQKIRLYARDARWRDALGFPVIVIGNRVKIPRLPFIRYVEG